jgi:hypothetical protein
MGKSVLEFALDWRGNPSRQPVRASTRLHGALPALIDLCSHSDRLSRCFDDELSVGFGFVAGR